MKNLFKKFVAVGLLVLFASSMFAEPASTGITDSDVKNWARLGNCSIWKENEYWLDPNLKRKKKKKTVKPQNGFGDWW